MPRGQADGCRLQQCMEERAVPCAAFDDHCHRIGMGAGYYDRFLPKLRPETPVWAAAYEIQKVTLISADPWDIPMNRIITESTVYFHTV